jgi:hypothetical protein
MCRHFYVTGNLLFYSRIWGGIWDLNKALAAAFLPSLTVTSSPRTCCAASLSFPRLQSSTHADSMLRQRQEPLCHMDGALLLASLVRLVWSTHLAVTWALFRLSALMDLYIHPLYVLVSKILSSILNSPALIHPLYA